MIKRRSKATTNRVTFLTYLQKQKDSFTNEFKHVLQKSTFKQLGIKYLERKEVMRYITKHKLVELIPITKQNNYIRITQLGVVYLEKGYNINMKPKEQKPKEKQMTKKSSPKTFKCLELMVEEPQSVTSLFKKADLSVSSTASFIIRQLLDQKLIKQVHLKDSDRRKRYYQATKKGVDIVNPKKGLNKTD